MDKLLLIKDIVCEKAIELNKGGRFSLWLEDDKDYLFSGELIERRKGGSVLILILDPDNKILDYSIEKKIIFGIPGKMFGYGYLKQLYFETF